MVPGHQRHSREQAPIPRLDDDHSQACRSQAQLAIMAAASGSIRPHHSTDVSRFLEEAAREKLDRMELERVIRDGAGSLKEKDYPHWRDQPSINEWVRAQRRTVAAP